MTSIKAFEDDSGNCTFAICRQSCIGKKSTLYFYESRTNDVSKSFKSVTLPTDKATLEWFKGNSFMIKDGRDESFYFGNARTGKMVLVNSFVDCNKDADHRRNKAEHGRNHDHVVKADLNPKTNQFLVFSKYFECFQLFQYDDKGGDPEVVAGGSGKVLELDNYCFRDVCLVNGILCAIADYSTKSLYPFSFQLYWQTLSVIMVDCTTGQVHPVKYFMEGRYGLNLNETSPACFSDKRFGVFFCKPNVMIIPEKQCTEWCFKITFECDSKIVNEQNMKIAIQEAEDIEVKERKERLQREERVAKFVDNDIELQGKIETWISSHGFIEASKIEAKKLGKIFVHESDIVNCFTGRLQGRKVKFRIVRQPMGKIKAVNVKIHVFDDYYAE
jgi:hypothetical protein